MTFFATRPELQFLPSAGAVSGEASTLGEVASDAWNVAGVGGARIAEIARSEAAYDARIDAIFKATGQRLVNPYRYTAREMRRQNAAGFEAGSSFDRFQQEMARLAEQYPHLAEVIQPQRSPMLDAGDVQRAAEERLASSLARSPWTATPNLPILGPTPLNPAALATGLVQGFTDPFTLATMPLLNNPVGLGARAVAWQGAKMAAVNAATEAVQQPFSQAWRKDAGLDYGWDQAKHALAGAVLFGFAIDAGGRSAFRGVRRLQGRTPTLDTEGRVIGWRAGADEAPPAAAGDPPPPAGPAGPDPVAAARDPMAALDEAAARAPDGSTLRRAFDGDDAALREVVAETGAHADPATRGALAELEHYRLFGPPPEIEPHEHFVRLAEAIQRAGDPEAPAPGSALRRTDPAARGPLDAGAEAALQRLRDQDGSLTDLAQVLRQRPDLVDGSVPVSDHKLRQAAGLAKLSDEAFDRVASGDVAPQHAALVGDRVLDPARHVEVLDAIARAGLRSAEQVRLLIGEMTSRAGAPAPHLARMGTDSLGRDLTGPRIKALDGALRGLPKDARIAGVVDRDLARLEAALPQAARGDAKVRAGLQKRMLDAVRALAGADSHVAELLDDAAQAVARGVKERTATAGLVQRLAAEIESGGVEGLVKPRRAAERLEGRGIDDPFGPEAQAQVKALDERAKFAVGDGKRRGGGDGGRGSSELSPAPAAAGEGRGRGASRGQPEADARGAQRATVRADYRAGLPVREFAVGKGLVGRVLREDLGDAHHLTVYVHDAKTRVGTVPADPVQAQTHLDRLNNFRSTVSLEEVRPGQFEVKYLQVDVQQRLQGLATRTYDAIERELGIELRPSGELTGDGYAFWRRRRPEALVHHRFDDRTQLWLSPLRMTAQREAAAALLARGTAPADVLADAVRTIAHYEAMLRTVPAEAKTPEALAQMFRLRDASDLTARGAAQWTDVRAEIDRVIARLPRGVRAEVVERLTWRGRDIEGMWDPHTAIVRIALGEGADRVLRHEEVHILRDLGLITEREWDVLAAKAAALDLRSAYEIDARYRAIYEPRARGDRSQLEAMLVEETIAEMRARHGRGERFGKPVDAILQRLADFIERVRNALHGRGFLAATDVFRRMETGEMAARRAELSADRGVRLSTEDTTAPATRHVGSPLRLADALSSLVGIEGKGFMIDEKHIVKKRVRHAGRRGYDVHPEMSTLDGVRALVSEVLGSATIARRYSDGVSWNLIKPLGEDRWAVVAIMPVPDANGWMRVKTAYITDDVSMANAIAGGMRQFGADGFRFREGDPGALEAIVGLGGRRLANAPDQVIHSTLADLRQRLDKLNEPPPGKAQIADGERVADLGTLAEVCKQ